MPLGPEPAAQRQALAPMPPSSEPAAPARWAVVALGVLPWVHPWAPGPESNTVPLLLGWGVAALAVLTQRWPHAGEWARIWAWAAGLSSVAALLQYAGVSASVSSWVHALPHTGEAMGNLRQRNQLATLTSMGAVALLWWRCHGLGRGWAVLCMLLLACGNAATGSRTGLVQWLTLPVLCALWQCTSGVRMGAWRLLCAGVLAYALASWGLPVALHAWQLGDVSHIASAVPNASGAARLGADDGCGSRLLLWANVLELVAQQPWSGWGWGQAKYAHYMNDFSTPRFCGVLGNAHNLPLHVALVAGWPAAAALVCAALWACVRGQAWRAATPVQRMGWGVWAMVGVHSMLEFPLWYAPFQLAALGAALLLWPAAGAWAAVHLRPVAKPLAALALVLAAWVGADHARMRQVFLPADQRWGLWAADPWTAAQASVFFQSTVAFAQLTTTQVTPANAPEVYERSLAVLRDAPEPAVIAKLIASARLTGREDVARWHEARLKKVFGTP